MRKSTLLWLALATFCGVSLFHTSQKVHDAQEKIASLRQAAAKEEESIRVLQAEWSHLNQPERLEKLVNSYLKLAPLKGRQFTRIEDIPLKSEQKSQTEETTASTKAEEIVQAPQPAPVAAVAVKSPVAAKPAPAAPVVKIKTPTAPTLAAAPARPKEKPSLTTAANISPAPASSRKIGDLIKSLEAE